MVSDPASSWATPVDCHSLKYWNTSPPPPLPKTIQRVHGSIPDENQNQTHKSNFRQHPSAILRSDSWSTYEGLCHGCTVFTYTLTSADQCMYKYRWFCNRIKHEMGEKLNTTPSSSSIQQTVWVRVWGLCIVLGVGFDWCSAREEFKWQKKTLL